jgi:hypothetical protein
MGLDTYAARIPVNFFDSDLDESVVDEDYGCTRRDIWALHRAQKKRERANGGYCLFEGPYFRGKLYVDLVRYVTGVSLYEWWIPPETVGKMAEAFRHCDPDETIRRFWDSGDATYRHDPSEVADFQVFFHVCRRRKLGLVGSW